MKIDELSEEDIGRWVKYTGGHGEVEYGRLKNWNDQFVFVVYNCGRNWGDYQNYTGASTKPLDLIFAGDILDTIRIENARVSLSYSIRA